MKYPQFVALLLLIVVSQTAIILGGKILIPSEKYGTLQQDDPSFKMTNQAVHQYFAQNYSVQLGQYVEVRYQVISGIRFQIIYVIGPSFIRIPAQVVYWRKQVKILESQIEFLPNFNSPYVQSLKVEKNETTSEILNQTSEKNVTDINGLSQIQTQSAQSQLINAVADNSSQKNIKQNLNQKHPDKSKIFPQSKKESEQKKSQVAFDNINHDTTLQTNLTKQVRYL